MVSLFLKVLVITLVFAGAAVESYSQADSPTPPEIRSSGRRNADSPLGLPGMLAKQRSERDKRDHKIMLERGEEALRLANQLEAAYEQNKSFSKQDEVKLESLEKVVLKIRDELGGDDEGERDDKSYMRSADEPRPSTTQEAFEYLKSTTVKLVDELKKTTRFTVSVIAIQSSNHLLKIVKFLRLRK